MTSFVSKEPKVCEFSLLSWLVTGSSICITRATEQQRDNIRDVKYGMQYIRIRNNLGPNGTKTNISMTNKGETNSMGRHMYTHIAPDKFPVLSTDAWEGALDILPVWLSQKATGRTLATTRRLKDHNSLTFGGGRSCLQQVDSSIVPARTAQTGRQWP
jgi:hypothetical protein